MRNRPDRARTSSLSTSRIVGSSVCFLASLAGTLLAQPQAPTPATAQPRAASPFRFAPVDDRSLGLWEDDRRVLVYNHRAPSLNGKPANPGRNSYLHPIHGLDGEVLTDDGPADHLHHRGLFWAWPHVTVDGNHHDMWLLQGIEPRFEKWLLRETGPESARLGMENGWFVGPGKIMRERLFLEVHRSSREGQAIDLDFTWEPTKAPVTLGGAEGKSYGGLTFRFAPGARTTITVPSGPTNDDLYMAKLPWADLTRSWSNQPARSGAAVFVHPSHPDFPPTWLTRHYGALCLGWPGVQPGTIKLGETIRCRYRVWIHRGEPDARTLERLFKAYVVKIDQADSKQRPTEPSEPGGHPLERGAYPASEGPLP